jgi:carboxyl-terminal processing protease
MDDGLIKVVVPFDEMPAARAGILPNDVVTQLDDESVRGLSLTQAYEKLRGPVNSSVKLTMMRKGRDEPFNVVLTRAAIRVEPVRWRLDADDVGYIRVSQFNEETTEALKRAIGELNNKSGRKLKGFIVDLRNIPGGLLNQAISVSDGFLERGEIGSTGRLWAGWSSQWWTATRP